MDFDLFLMVCNYIGTIAFAASGAIKGFGKRLDIFDLERLSQRKTWLNLNNYLLKN